MKNQYYKAYTLLAESASYFNADLKGVSFFKYSVEGVIEFKSLSKYGENIGDFLDEIASMISGAVEKSNLSLAYNRNIENVDYPSITLFISVDPKQCADNTTDNTIH